MRKGNMTILASILAISLVSVAFGASTLAWFSDTQSTTDTATFTAGELSIEVTDGSFETPGNWAPGDTAILYLSIENKGNIDITQLLLRDVGYEWTGCNFKHAILITGCDEKVWPATDWMTSFDPNDMTLATYFLGKTSGPGIYTDYDWRMLNFAGRPVLKPGEILKFRYYLEFDENAGNEYQGATCSFNIEVYVSQGPVESLPGYVLVS